MSRTAGIKNGNWSASSITQQKARDTIGGWRRGTEDKTLYALTAIAAMGSLGIFGSLCNCLKVTIGGIEDSVVEARIVTYAFRTTEQAEPMPES